MSVGVELVFIVFVLVLLGGVGTGYWLTRYRPTCPYCGQQKAQEIDKTVQETRQVIKNDGNGSWGAGGLILETVYEVRFRCQACQHVWSERDVE